jgi:membrane associated rhomboid family serine protease
MQTCYRHPDRETGVSCSNCDRPICPDCMTTTPVGMRCPECARETTRVVTLRDEPGLARRAPVTAAIIALNVAVFVIGVAIDAGGGIALRGGFGELQAQGALYGPLVAEGEWWRIVTSGFLHSGLLHVAFNMFLIYVLGSQIEQALGGVRYTVLYFGSLLAGSLGSLLLQPQAAAVGASGAGFGLMGAFAVVGWARGLDVWRSGIGGLILLNIVITFSIPNIAVGGHLGGLIGGALLGALFAVLDDRARVFGDRRWPAVALGVAFGAVCFGGALIAAEASIAT